MTLDLPMTLAILSAGLGLFGFASWRARQPPDPLRPRMVNYGLIQLAAILVVLLMAAHVASFMGIHTGGRLNQ
jgi:hypothetical protein